MILFPSGSIPPLGTKISKPKVARRGSKNHACDLVGVIVRRATLTSILGSQTCVFLEKWHTIFSTLVESIYYNLGIIAEICATIKDLKDAAMVTHTILSLNFSFG